MRAEKELIEEAQEFLTTAQAIQDETVSLKQREQRLSNLSTQYHEWYRQVLALFNERNQPDERQKFEQEYEGSFWSQKILKFLTSGLKSNPLHDAENPLTNNIWLYPFDRCFEEPLHKQCNLIANLEAASATSIANEQANLEWNSTVRRIFQAFIDKSEAAQTNHEKKLTYEYLAIFLVGSVEGLSLIAHDARGKSEEVDLWVANEAKGGFWERHVGDPFMVECKNWGKPIGVQEVRNLRAIMDDKNIRFSLLLSKQGVTGDKYRDAISIIQKAASENKYIIVLDHADLLDMASGSHPAEVIRQKFYGLYTI